MRHILVFLVSLFACLSMINAQVDSFKIADYVRPDLIRRTLFLDGGASFFNCFDCINNNMNNQTIATINPSLLSTRFENSVAEQKTITHKSRLYSSFYKKIDDRRDDWDLNADYSYSSSKKRFAEDKRFWEFTKSASLGLYNTSFSSASSQFRTNDGGWTAHVGAGVFRGKGRIELITDAWHAVTILEFLENADLLVKAVSAAEIKALADALAESKNLRNTDSRFEQIAEYKLLFEHLEKSGWVNTKDVSFAPVFLDALQNEGFTNRWSGKEFKVGLRPYIQTISLDQIIYALPIEVAYNRYKPLANDWQLTNENRLNIGTQIQYSRLGNRKDQHVLNASIFTGWQLEYLPSARTNLSLRGGFSYISRTELGGSRFTTDYDLLSLQFGFAWNYYVSPKFAWTLSSNLDLSTRTERIENLQDEFTINFGSSYRFY